MKKFSMFFVPLLCGISLLSCNEKEVSSDNPVPPTASVKISNVTRTSADITVETDEAADYAYAIVNDSESVSFSSAEELFEKGETGIFESGKVTIHTDELTGGQNYTVYAATRKINPFIYSEIVKTEINTNIEFKDLITLDKVGLTDFTYHIEIPAERPENSIYKHIAVNKADYEAIKKIFESTGSEMTYGSYLGTFGHQITESGNTTLDKYAETALQDAIHIYSGTPHLIIAGHATTENPYKIDEASVEVLEFSTRKADETPYNVEITVSDITSLTATVSVKPEEGITEYRMLISKTEDFDYAAFEGESSVRATIIGAWDDEQNIASNAGKRSYTEAATVNPSGLAPLRSYTVGIVAFDSDRREKLILKEFSTTEPTGPKPEITASVSKTETPWNSISFNIKATHAASGYICPALKSDYDEIISAGGSIDDIIIQNGTPLSADDIAKISSEEGLSSTIEELTANTEYTLGIYIANPESVGISKRIDFKTDEIPQIGGEIRANMPGEYTATTKDENGKTVTFPVTITTGVNEATTNEYKNKNRLVALGFALQDQYPYTSPEEMISKGWAKDEAEANTKYGPKWFIEFQQDGTINTGNLVNYSLDYFLGFHNTTKLGFCGYSYNAEKGKWTDTTSPVFPITVSEDGNTITVGAYEYEGWSGITVYYPGIMDNTGSDYYGDKIFASTDVIVLTRNSKPSTTGLKAAKALKATKYITFDVNAATLSEKRSESVEKLTRQENL